MMKSGNGNDGEGEGKGKGGDEDGGGGDEVEWEKWRFESGVESHTWLFGEMNWFVGVKE